MATSKQSVVGLAHGRVEAERSVQQLIASGFRAADISVLFPDTAATREFAYEKNTKAPEGAAVGVSAGGVAGGALGALVGLGALTIPGLGVLLAAGPVVAALSGAAVGAAVGGVGGALIGMGIPEVEAKLYEGELKSGKVLIAVHVEDGRENRAKDILDAIGAESVSTMGETEVPRAEVQVPRTSTRM